MNSVTGWATSLYLLLGSLLAAAIINLYYHVFELWSPHLTSEPGIEFLFSVVIALIPLSFITLSIAIAGAILKRVPIYVPFLCSIFPLLIVWGFEMRMLGDAPKDYWVDFLPALIMTVIPSMFVWGIIRVIWGPVSR
jgi:hypothetical protein